MSLNRREKNWLSSCAHLAQTFSTCAKRQYFAVVLAPNGRVAGVGYNGSPPGVGHCIDGHCPRFIEDSPSGSVYDNCIAHHAEANALLWSDPAMRIGGTLIVNGTPCHGCSKTIASSGVARLVYVQDVAYSNWSESEKLLESSGIELVPVSSDGDFIGSSSS